jgi:hypothetical protein
MLKPLFYRRDYTLNPFQAEWLEVDGARWAAVGGPDWAQLSGASQGRLDLARALGLLRCGVELVDESGQACWWGYVERVELWSGVVGAICDLNEMTNRAKVSYTRLDFHAAAGGVKDATLWAEDLNSQGIYGVKEKVIRLQGSTSAQAQAARNVELIKNGYPVARPALSKAPPGARPDMVIILKGWWHSLAWRTYSQVAGLVEHVAVWPAVQDLGKDAHTAQLAQSFTVTVGGWQLNSIWVHCCRVGPLVNDLLVYICPDNAGSPGVPLVTLHVPPSEITWKSYAWKSCVFPSPITLGAGQYWAVFGGGNQDGVSYYRLILDSLNSYAGGVFKIYDVNTWASRVPDADLNFRMVGGMETTQQISLMAAAGCGGQFLSGISIETASGLYTNSFRAGDRTALDEIAAQLKAGDVNNNRLLAEVTQQRTLRVYAAPAVSTAKNHIDATGHLVDLNGAPLPAWALAAGRWAVLDSPWLGTGGENLHISDRVFLEAVEYDRDLGRLQPG